MSQTPTPSRPADRYGRTSTSSSRKMIITGAVLVSFITAWVIWDALAMSGAKVSYSLVSQQVLGPARTDVTFVITLDPGEKAICTVQALNAGKTIVGNVDVTVGPSKDREFTSTVQVPTMEQATGSQVKACVPA
jgi:hypothetical protein